tara:strand:- start:3640 stop:3915 length:276 start_codon:yes stop_codon:yes gene_type:complete
MSWEDLDIDHDKVDKSKAEIRERQVELAKAYHRCFSTDDGLKVLEDLSRKFIMENETPLSSANINYEAAYHNGETGVVKFIVHLIKRAEVL